MNHDDFVRWYETLTPEERGTINQRLFGGAPVPLRLTLRQRLERNKADLEKAVASLDEQLEFLEENSGFEDQMEEFHKLGQSALDASNPY